MKITVSLLLVLCALASCTTAPPARVEPIKLAGTAWQLQASGENAVPEKRPDIHFGDGHVSGFAGCNRFFGRYTVTDDQLRFSELGSTRMACADGMTLEQHLLNVFAGVRRFDTQGNELTLLDASGNLLARYHLIVTPDSTNLLETTYRCTDKASGNTLSIDVTFGDNQVTVSAGTERLTMARIPSASGARYGNDNGAFWSHHSEAMFNLDDTMFQCTHAPSSQQTY